MIASNSLSILIIPPVINPAESTTVRVASPATYVPPSSIVVVVADSDQALTAVHALIATGVVPSPPLVTVN